MRLRGTPGAPAHSDGTPGGAGPAGLTEGEYAYIMQRWEIMGQ